MENAQSAETAKSRVCMRGKGATVGNDDGREMS